MLVRLVYTSKAIEIVTPLMIGDILDTAIERNRQNNITGMLCLGGNVFMQCLEGDQKAVNATYQRIVQDPRHADVLLLSYRSIIDRDFSDWNMGYVGVNENTQTILEPYFKRNSFSPSQLDDLYADALMLDLRKYLLTQT